MAGAAAGRPRRLLAAVFVAASVITAVLSLDATVVLLTPVVFATAARLGARAKPHVYAAAHLSNTSSLLLPVSNLTNLLAFAASGLSFTRFAALMAVPWLAAIAVEYVVMRRFFATELHAGAQPPPAAGPAGTPLFALVTVACTLAGFVLASAAASARPGPPSAGRWRWPPARWSGATRPGRDRAGRGRALPRLRGGAGHRGARGHRQRAGRALGHLVPGGASLPALLAVAVLAAGLANVINNLPAVLVLLPLAAPAGPGAVLAVLAGVNIGPNLTYAGSLANLLWRRIVHQHDTEVNLGEFTRLGLLTVPAALVVWCWRCGPRCTSWEADDP